MSVPVFVYALSTCPWCRRTKQFFIDNDVPFDFVDVDLLPEDEELRVSAEAREVSGSRSYPIVKIGDEVIVGYNPGRYSTLLGIQQR
jgi:glutaredoxin